MFMGPCIVSILQYISNKMQRYTVYLHLETTLHISVGTSTHQQERIQLYLQHLVFVTPLLLPAAISWNRFECAVGGVHQIPDAVDTGVCSPDDVWKYHPQYVEQFPDINKLCNVASCWIYIELLLGAHRFLHINRIRVKCITIPHLVKKFLARRGTRTIISMFTVFVTVKFSELEEFTPYTLILYPKYVFSISLQ
jgi:hypothetical protein